MRFPKPSFTSLIVGLVLLYLLMYCRCMYGIVYTTPCENPEADTCVSPYLATNPRLQLSIYALRVNADGGDRLIHREEEFDVNTRFERLINVSLPENKRKNETLYAMVFLHQAGVTPWQDPHHARIMTQLTTYRLPKPPEISLITGQDDPQKPDQQQQSDDPELDQQQQSDDPELDQQQQSDDPELDQQQQSDDPELDQQQQSDDPELDQQQQSDDPELDQQQQSGDPELDQQQQSDDPELDQQQQSDDPELDRPVSHWHSRLTLNVMSENFLFDLEAIPGDVRRYMRAYKSGEKSIYLPLLVVNKLGNREKDLMEINSRSSELPLTISYDPITLGKLRFLIYIRDRVASSLQQFGFTENDVDEIMGIFVDTNLYFLALSFFVAVFQRLFDFLAFKHDIIFWKHKKSMVGMSRRAVLWGCFSTIVIFLYLLDEQTSLLVLIPAGIRSLFEVWKVKKAFKIHVIWRGLTPTFLLGKLDESEKQTEHYDTLVMKYLSYLLYPLCLGVAVYALVFVKYKGWYSWIINSLVNGVYAFGFLFVVPQLFVNYKIKSVAHLSWNAFVYKAFNTVLDDVSAFIITTPTSHWLACFRDDLVLLAYLYQRWLYPVDKTRVNEYGVSSDEKPKGKVHED